MSRTRKSLYAAIGAGGVALEIARELPQRVTSIPSTLASRLSDDSVLAVKLPKSIDIRRLPGTVRSFGGEIPTRATRLVDDTKELSSKARKRARKTYGDLSKRGETIVKRVRRSAPTKRAVERTKAAKSRIKAATTSVRKAADADVEAAKAAIDTASEQAS